MEILFVCIGRYYQIILGDIIKDIKGVKMTPLGVYVDQKSLIFPGLIASTLIQNGAMYYYPTHKWLE